MSEYWDRFDINNDGKLDKLEFRAFILEIYSDVLKEKNGGVPVDSAMLEAKINSEFEQIFDDFDTDKNGFITKDEMYYFVLELLGYEVQQNVDFQKMKTQKIAEEQKSEEKKQEKEEEKVPQIDPEIEELLAQLRQKDAELEEVKKHVDKIGGDIKAEINQKSQELEKLEKERAQNQKHYREAYFVWTMGKNLFEIETSRIQKDLPEVTDHIIILRNELRNKKEEVENLRKKKKQ